MLYSTFAHYLNELNPSVFHIFLHHNADPDALGAAKILKFMISKLNINHEIKIYSDNLNVLSKRMVNEFEVVVFEEVGEINENNNNIVITVDTANISQLGKFADWVLDCNFDLLVIDHHETSELSKNATVSLIDKNVGSTCIIVDKLMNELNLVPSPDIATIILCGHIYDSRRMLYGTNSKILLRLSELIDIGGDFELANNLLQNNMSYGERIARIKGARRLSYYTHDQRLIVISKVGAFEASVARSLINMGADVVLVLGIKNNEMRGSGRTNIKNLNIGNIMKIIGEKFGGTGGGHAAAAGLNIVPMPEKKLLKKIEEEFIDLIKKEFES